MNPPLRHAVIALALVLAGCEPPKPLGPQQIKIETEPDGATLVVDGHEIGKSPQSLTQPPFGKHLIQASKDGFLPLDQTLVVGADTPPDLTLKLERLHGLVLFETTPSGAEVSINSIVKGRTPYLSTDLPAGSYKIGFALDGYDPREAELIVTDRTPKLCSMNMKSNLATVRVESKPAGAAVIIDGSHRGVTPCTVENVLIGNHKLKLIKDGFKEYVDDDFKISQSGTVPVSVSLKEQFAVLDVTSTPSEAKVTVNEKYKGLTPLQVGDLRDGKYTVLVERLGFEKVTRTVEIKKTENAKLDVTLEKSTGTIALNIKPEGALVVVNSEQKGVSAEGPFTRELMPGKYKIEISKAGHRPASFEAEIVLRKTFSKDVTLQRIWEKDTVLELNTGRVREGMVISEYPNGTIRIETAPGIFEEYTKEEIKSKTPIKK